MGKAFVIFDVLRKGSAVTDPALWKKGGEALKLAIIAFALSLNDIAKAFGHDLHIDQSVAGAVAAIAVWVVGLFFTAATSAHVGLLPPKRPPADRPNDGSDDPAMRAGG